MAQDLGLDHSSTTAFTITINSVADAGSAEATSIDFGTPGPLALGIHAVLDGTAGGTSIVIWKMLWSEDNSAFPDATNARIIGTTTLNEATALDDVFTVPVEARYGKLRFENESGASMETTGNSVEYWEIWGNQV